MQRNIRAQVKPRYKCIFIPRQWNSKTTKNIIYSTSSHSVSDAFDVCVASHQNSPTYKASGTHPILGHRVLSARVAVHPIGLSSRVQEFRNESEGRSSSTRHLSKIQCRERKIKNQLSQASLVFTEKTSQFCAEHFQQLLYLTALPNEY